MSNRKKGKISSRKSRFGSENTRGERLAFFVETLVEWFGLNGRDLPWRRTRDPYKILVSEIMLQQTNVDIVIPIYKKFLQQFPTIRILAQSSI